MPKETFPVPEAVAALSLDIAEFVEPGEGTAPGDRDELLQCIDEVCEEMLGNPESEVPIGMVQALEIGWKTQLGAGDTEA